MSTAKLYRASIIIAPNEVVCSKFSERGLGWLSDESNILSSRSLVPVSTTIHMHVYGETKTHAYQKRFQNSAKNTTEHASQLSLKIVSNGSIFGYHHSLTRSIQM